MDNLQVKTGRTCGIANCGSLTHLSHEVSMVHESVIVLLNQDVVVCQKLGMLLPQLLKIVILTAWTLQLAL